MKIEMSAPDEQSDGRGTLLRLSLLLIALAAFMPSTAGISAFAEDVTPAFPPRDLAGPWHQGGDYRFDDVGLDLHLTPGQQTLILSEKLPDAIRGCYDHVEALIYDDRGLSFIGRTNTGYTILDSRPDMGKLISHLDSYRGQQPIEPDPLASEERKLDRAVGMLGHRSSALEVAWARKPVYDKQTGTMRWSYAVQSGWVHWLASFWVRFDFDGYVAVFLMSRDHNPDQWNSVSSPPPIAWRSQTRHARPAEKPEGRTETVGEAAAELDETIMRCALDLPFGENF